MKKTILLLALVAGAGYYLHCYSRCLVRCLDLQAASLISLCGLFFALGAAVLGRPSGCRREFEIALRSR
jgi:hypothetical protein